MRNSRLLLLDLGNVLLQFLPDRFVERAAACSSRSQREIRERYIHGHAKRDFECGKISEKDFMKEMSGWLGWDEASNGRLVDVWNDVFDPVEGVVFALKSLIPNYKIWVLSDTNPPHHRYFVQRYAFLNVVERYFLSYESGHLKSDRRAFLPVIDAATGNPSDIIFLDDLETNVATASGVGIRSAVFRSWAETLPMLLNEATSTN